MQMQIAKKQDLINVLGPNFALTMLGLKTNSMKRLPQSVTILPAKPKFYLDDGATMVAYAVDLESGLIENTMFCGSGGSTINFMGQQLSEGFTPPHNKALVFVEKYWNGRNTSWTLTIVSNQTISQLEA